MNWFVLFFLLVFSGSNISTDQEDHAEDPSDLLPHGYCNRVSHGYRYGGKMQLWWENVSFDAWFWHKIHSDFDS